jgi:NAD(P)-dependent dehydrogenase (short-subunit alcohol dehydrogenase family)
MQRLNGKVAIVTGASRGAGRGIALALGEAGATVYVTGRSVQGASTRADLPDTTIDATAELVTTRGGVGIPVRVDHTVDTDVAALFARVRDEQGRLDVLVNNAFGGEELGAGPMWAPFWEQPLERWDALRLVRAHIVAARLAVPLMRTQERGLIVHTGFGVGVAEQLQPHEQLDPNDLNLFFYLAVDATNRVAFMMGRDLAAYQYPIAVVALGLGWIRTERLLRANHTDEQHWHTVPELKDTQSPLYGGRAVVALATDPDVLQKTGRQLGVSELAREYGFTDSDGRQP